MADKTIREAAFLAKIAITPEEEARLAADFADILRFAGELRAVDTENVPMTRHIHPLSSILREDAPRPALSAEDVLNAAPACSGDFIAVPRTLV